MKKPILLVLSLMMALVIQAGDVTPEQALQQAKSFMQQRAAAGINPKRSQALASELKMAGRVSGLYVFNSDGDNGYVIVSNDDRTAAVLGYSDSGQLDLDNMPENMRAWLQGYADEIAWLDAHNYQPSPVVARRAASAVKQPIAPLMATRWNQDAPFNDLCPEYTSGKKSATGCVATAMAQVMKYHNYAEMTGGLPAFDKDFSDTPCIPVAALPQTTFDWGNMLDVYSGGYTAAQGAAVAKLMQYCGSSIKMSYGDQSSSNANMIPDALKNYFGYNSTARTAMRSLYTYNEWLEMMYHELSESRPVAYGGQSSGGGHSFVCDGYQGEDYFHINWGWGGKSDNYFKLSVLNSDEQGIGGSSSKDGYHYGQMAVVGVQKPTDSGTVLDVTMHYPNLTVNSTTCPDVVEVGEEVSVTLNVTNNSEFDYSGDIYLGNKMGAEDFSLLVGDLFEIPAKTAKDCTIKLTFTSAGTYQLVIFWPNEYGSYSTNGVVLKTITVTSGSGNPVTKDIDLGATLTVETAELVSGKNYYVYGKTFKGQLTVTNPDATHDYDGYYQYSLYQYDGKYHNLANTATHIRVPANGSVNIPIEYDGLVYGTLFEVDVVYQKETGWTAYEELAYFAPQPAVITYAADGTFTVTKTTSTSYDAPATALAVDLTGTTVETVSGGATNCLFISNKSSIAGAANFVKYTSGTYTAANITITDGSDFFTPVDFTATNVEFTYDNDRWADGTNGWNTIMLPFDVTGVTANGTPIDWFHSGSDTGKQFWLKEFTGDDTTAPKVYFDYVSGPMQANTPYIIALPGNHWGAANDLSGKTIKFVGENATVHKKGDFTSVTGTNYRFIGTTTQDATSNIYRINAAGNKFELASGCAPFRAYFKPGIFDSGVSSLSINNGGETTGIQSVDSGQLTVDSYFNLAGQRVVQPTKGLYIVNGKKVVIK